MRHDLHSVQLHDCAGVAASGLRIVDGAHAFLDPESAASWRKCVGFSLEGGGGGGFEEREVGAAVEAIRSGRSDGADCANRGIVGKAAREKEGWWEWCKGGKFGRHDDCC